MAGWRHLLSSFYPWILWVGLYFYIEGTDYPVPSYRAALLKIFPIITLVFMVIAAAVKDEAHKKHQTYTLVGLIFSAVGDVFMVWIKTMMTYGGLAFAAAHVCYMLGVRKPGQRSWVVMCLCMSGCAALCAWIVQHIPDPNEQIGIAMYLFLVCAMVWQMTEYFVAELTLSAALGCLGGCVFVVSDMLIFIDKFAFPVQNANLWIMLTYYCAQLGIASSVALYKLEFVDPPEDQGRKRQRRARYTSK